MERATSPSNARHLSVVDARDDSTSQRLTRAQVASRLGASISTVRRYEGVKLHPTADEAGVHWFAPAEVTALAAERANTKRTPTRNATPTGGASIVRTAGETAALVFERFEQRQSLAEIVIGLRIEPDVVRALFDQWTLGLTAGHLRRALDPAVPRDGETPWVTRDALAARLAELPHGVVTRISVGRYRGPLPHGDYEYADVVELGGFLVSGQCDCTEITGRYGAGAYRVTAYGFDPAGLRWEVFTKALT